MSEGKPINSSQVTKTVTSWADAVEEEECRPPQTFSLPTAPRASRVFDYVPENSPYTAYLSKLPYDANREDIEEFFSDLHITDIKLPREDDNSTKNRGFAYVEFAERGDLIAAISLPDPTLMNRRFKIDLPNEEQGKRGGGGGRGRYDNFGSNVDENSTNWRKDTREDNDGGGLGRRPGGGGGGGGGYTFRDRDRQQRDPSPETGNWREKQKPRSDSPPDRFQKGNFILDLSFGPLNANYSIDAISGRYNQDRERDSNNDFRRGDASRDGDRDRYPRRNNPNNGYEDRSNRETTEEAPRERPKLNLAPRTLPMPELKVAEEEEEVKNEEEEIPKVEEEVEPPRPKPTPVPAATIFGNAKPVDTAAKEREIEERMEKQRALEEEKERERNEKASAEENSEKEPEVVEDNQVNSWRRRDNERNIDDLPRTQSPPRRRFSPDRRGGRKFGMFFPLHNFRCYLRFDQNF